MSATFDQSPITLICESQPRAKLAHTCGLCGFLIPSGEKHTRFVYRYNLALDRRNLRCVRFHFTCPPMEGREAPLPQHHY